MRLAIDKWEMEASLCERRAQEAREAGSVENARLMDEMTEQLHRHSAEHALRMEETDGRMSSDWQRARRSRKRQIRKAVARGAMPWGRRKR